MEKFEIQPIPGSALPDVARFLRRWRADRDEESSIERPVAEDVGSTERRLRWLLLENPLATGVSQHGFCIRDASGAIRGLDISFPNAFVAGDQRLLGLCSGAFFVEPEARMLGFFLFKRHLSSSGYSFFFSTSCNANSGPVWKTMGGRSVPNSDTEYILPLRLDVMFPTFLTGTISNRAAGMARIAGQCANPVLQLLARKATDLTIEPCRDWEKLSSLFHRHRCAQSMTTDRSAAFLAWRYAENSPNHPADICLFRDKSGNEGWFALGHVVRGRQEEIQGRILMDAIWPRDKMNFTDIFPAILRRVADKTDAIFFHPRSGIDYGECSRWIIPRRGPTRIFAVAAKGGPPVPVSSLDLVPADGDSAFRISVWPERF
jgi:hypothetical protein